jgi:gliding motility-associated-like protein
MCPRASIILLAAFNIISGLNAQNLVPNSGFDVYTTCPSTSSQFNLTPPWTNVSNVSGTPDYMNACFGGNQGVPVNFYGNQVPVSGSGYYGLITYYNTAEVREYLSVPLTCTLTAGVEYEVGFHVSLSDNFRFATDHFGAYFSSGPLFGSDDGNALPFVPQVDNPAGNVLSDMTNWTFISGTFIASGNETYLTLGNFHTDNQTQVVMVNSSSSLQWAYYYVDEVYVIPLGSATPMASDTTLCTGTTLDLDVTTSGASYLWQDGSTSAQYSVTAPGTYWVQIFYESCTLTDTIQVSYMDAPNGEIGNDTTLCSGSTLSIDVTIPDGSYLWQDGSTSPQYAVTVPGTYWIQVSGGGCTWSDSITVQYAGPPDIELGSDTALCPGASFLVDVFVSGASYLWFDGTTEPQHSIDLPGSYWVQVELDGCIVYDTLIVSTIGPGEVQFGNDTIICPGETLLLYAGSATAEYLWQDGSSQSGISVTTPGLYWVHVTMDGCVSSDTMEVDVMDVPGFILGYDIRKCEGSAIIIASEVSLEAITWNTGSTGSSISVDSSGTYWIQGEWNGCMIADTILIDLVDCNAEFDMPNVFSPNGDGFNDHFGALQDVRLQNPTLFIYGRWGDLIHSTSDITYGWNGRYNGMLCPEGTYYWVIEHGSTERHRKHGHVTLVR